MSNYNIQAVNSTDGLLSLIGMATQQGRRVGSRNGQTYELCHLSISLDRPWERELLCFSRKHDLAAQIAETMWVLAGRNDIEFLSHYLPRAKDYSDDGATWRSGYGPRIRGWYNPVDMMSGIDQLEYVIEELQANPLSRQAVMMIWDPVVDTTPGKDKACNDLIQFTLRDNALDMHVYVRSNDIMWGWSGINTFEWSTLQEIVAGMLAVQIGRLHFTVGSMHLYEHHWQKAEQIYQVGAFGSAHGEISWSPRFNATGIDDVEALDELIGQWLYAEEAIRTHRSEAGWLVEDFPEPMLQSWLRVLQWYWSGDKKFLDPVKETRLWHSALMSNGPRKVFESENTAPAGKISFIPYVDNLHREKAKAYGDSWKRRGEMLSIMANVARKLDRFGRPDIDGENAADTAIDLLVYLLKYRWWLAERDAPIPFDARLTNVPFSDSLDLFTGYLDVLGKRVIISPDNNLEVIEQNLNSQFNELEKLVMAEDEKRYVLVDAMISNAFRLAFARYDAL